MTPNSRRRLPAVFDLIPRAEVFLAAVATAAFPLAVLLPLFTFRPSAGDELIEGAIELVEPGAFDAQTYSVLGVIARLFGEGTDLRHGAIALVLVVFSVMFPVAKLGALWAVIARPGRGGLPTVRRLEALGRWSMADVFVLAVTVVAMKSLPLGSRLDVEAGYWLFLGSVLSAMLATWLAHRRLAGPDGTPPSGSGTVVVIRVTPDRVPPPTRESVAGGPGARALPPADG